MKFLKGDTLTKRCIGVINQSNLKGKALADAILYHLKTLNLPLETMIGQDYGWNEFYIRKRKKTFKRL